MDYVAKSIYVFPPSLPISAYPIFFCPEATKTNNQPTLVIQDPLNEKHNVGRPTYNIKAIKFLFAVGFAKLVDYQAESLEDFLRCGKSLALKL